MKIKRHWNGKRRPGRACIRWAEITDDDGTLLGNVSQSYSSASGESGFCVIPTHVGGHPTQAEITKTMREAIEHLRTVRRVREMMRKERQP